MASAKDRLGFLGLVALALLAAGGAARSPGGILIGAPGLALTAVILLASFLVAIVVGVRGAAPAAGFAVLPLALLLLPRVAAALTGPPILAFVLAGGAIVASRRPGFPRMALVPVAFLLFALVGARARHQVGAEGDEPHYLMVAESLIRDHDLALEDDYTVERYGGFHQGTLEPHYRVRGLGGHIYSLHALGLSLLLLPAYAVGGYAGASLFMALLAALLVGEIRDLSGSWSGSLAVGEGIGWLSALSPPILHFAGLIFTEIPAALIVALVLNRGGRRSPLFVGLGAAFLPWLNVRYAPITVLLILFVLLGRPPRRVAFFLVLPSLLSALGLVLFYHHLYGFFDPRRVYGARPELSIHLIPQGLQGLLLDQEFGLLTYAPVFVLALPGLYLLARRTPLRGAIVVLLVLAVGLTAAAWPMWRGGFNPPARFFVPVVAPLMAAVGLRLSRGLGGPAALLVGFTLFTGLLGAWAPRLVHRDRQGSAPLFREESGALEWTTLLPRYVLEEPDRHVLALILGGMLLVAAFSTEGDATVGGCAGAALGLLLATTLLSRSGQGWDEGRSAVRLLGRGAVELPGFRRVDSAQGAWRVPWGPLYEPHRHPEGALLGDRLRLPPGRYRLTLRAQSVGEGAAPTLEVLGRSTLLQAEPGGFGGTFEVPQGAPEVGIRLEGGSPIFINETVLATQPSPVPPV